MVIRFPFDILHTICEEVDDVRDLYHIRMASRTLCVAATPFAFRVFDVSNSTEKSAQKVEQLFDTPHMAAHVRAVIYDDTDVVMKEGALEPQCVFFRAPVIP